MNESIDVKEINIKELANLLAVNHITNSVINHDDNDINTILSGTPTKNVKKNYDKYKRFILIVGAGCSFNALSSLSLANKASNSIKETIKADYKSIMFDKLYKRELDRLSEAYKLDKSDFETVLLALNRFFPETVIRELIKKYNKKYNVSLFYELVAHMLKHRFLDVVINYNFDELLDNTIDEELRGAKFSRIYSDGHCPNNYEDEMLYNINGGLKYPVYIKPHGTISHSSSLRFTRKAYFDLSRDIQILIENLFAGKDRVTNDSKESTSEVESEEKVNVVNIIVVGFSMKSPQLNKIIKNLEILDHDKKPQKINCYIINNEEKHKFVSSLDKDLVPKLDIYYHQTTKEKTINDFISDLWNEISLLYDESLKPKRIERHKLVSFIFENRSTNYNNCSDYQNYYYCRTLVEIAILILESDGIVNSSLIRNSRVMKYYKLYKKENGSFNISRLLFGMGLVKYKNYIKDTYLFDFNGFYLKGDKLENQIFENLLRNIKRDKIRNKLSEERDFIIKEFFQKIRQSNLLNIHVNEDAIYDSKFEEVVLEDLIRTDLDWSYRFREAYESKRWDLFLAISERGRFLLNNSYLMSKDDSKKRVIELIVSNIDSSNYLRPPKPNVCEFNLLYNNFNKEFLSLPWWLHNQHLALFIKVDSDLNLKPVKGFYFRSRLLNRIVTPIEVNNENDLQTLLDTYLTYRFRAESYLKSNKKGVENPQSKKDIDLELQKLRELYKSSKNL